MNRKKNILIIIPLIVIGIAVLFISTESTKDIIQEDRIIQQTKLKEIEIMEEKTDEDILQEIETKYNELEKRTNSTEYKVMPREWQTSGPFSIDRHEYALGEKIFLNVNSLEINEIGQISILRTMNQTHYKVWTTYNFDGTYGESFNVYFEPKLSKFQEICSKDDLIGEWVMVFQNTDYENLRFKINDKIVPGDENNFNLSVC